MNADRRKRIAEAAALVEQAQSILESCRDEEQEYYDNMPESLQSGEKGEKAQTASDALDSAVSTLEDVVSSIEEAVSA